MKLIEDDILKQTSGLIVHGCNAQSVMGSGLAAQIREKYPKVFTEYCKIPVGQASLGTFQPVQVSETLFIGNCITQLYFGRDGKRYADINAIRKSLEKAFFWCYCAEQPIHIPEIGCGLGGLKPWEVTAVIEELQREYLTVPVTVYRFKP